MKILRWARWLWIVFVLFGMTALYCGAFRQATPWRHGSLSLQFTPVLARLEGSASALVIAAVLLALTLVSGRVFCSVLCPAGILQELSGRAGRWLRRGRSRFAPFSASGLVAMTAAAVGLLFGLDLVAGLLDPIGLFGRLADPLAALWTRYALDQGSLRLDATMAALGGVSVVLLVLIPLFKGRWFCDRLCPAGACLGIVSSVSRRNMAVDADACVGCGQCEKVCPMRCIDARAKTIDPRRCVLCLECAKVCPRRAIRYAKPNPLPRPATPAMPATTTAPVTSPAIPASAGPAPAPATKSPTAPGDGTERRTFLRSGLAWAAAALFLSSRRAAVAVADTTAADGDRPPPFPMPPGAGEWGRYRALCVSCQSCARACPAEIIRTKSGTAPLLDFDRGYCIADCVACGRACPAGALRRTHPDDRKTLRLAEVSLVLDRCVIIAQDGRQRSCGACAEVCPTFAVTMVPQADPTLPTRPSFDPRYCIGCGACYNVCPVTPQAFVVKPLARQGRSEGFRVTVTPAASASAPSPEPERMEDFPF